MRPAESRPVLRALHSRPIRTKDTVLYPMHSATTGTPPRVQMDFAMILKHPILNGWGLFWSLVLPMTAFMCVAMTGFDLASADGVSHMIQYSVRWAVPFIYLVTAASAMPILFPSEFTRWWARNRRYMGLVFAVAMSWQGAFIFIMSNVHSGYYYGEVYLLRDELEGSSGYLFLAAMVITSFRFGRQLLSSAQWKVLHRCGVYFLWAYPFSVYWWSLYYYGNPLPIDHVFYWAGFLAFAARIAAWGKKRRQQLQAQAGAVSLAARTTGAALIGAGLLASATAGYWREPTSSFLLAPQWSATLELWLPFWPFEPFLSLFALGIGTWLLTGGLRAGAASSETAPARA
jgi:hypothetical protein